MIDLLCFFMPSLLFASLYCRLKNRITVHSALLAFSVFVIISNLFCFIILLVSSGVEYMLILSASPLFFVVKYLMLNLVMNLIVFSLYASLAKKFSFKIHLIKGDNNEE